MLVVLVLAPPRSPRRTVKPRWNPRRTFPQTRPQPPRSLSGLRPQAFSCWGGKRNFLGSGTLFPVCDLSGNSARSIYPSIFLSFLFPLLVLKGVYHYRNVSIFPDGLSKWRYPFEMMEQATERLTFCTSTGNFLLGFQFKTFPGTHVPDLHVAHLVICSARSIYPYVICCFQEKSHEDPHLFFARAPLRNLGRQLCLL